MSRQSRVQLCRFGFTLFCLVPTLVVGRFVFWPDTPENWRSQIRDQLGVNAAIGEVSHPRPDITLLDDVELADPETGHLLALNRVELRKRNDQIIVVAGHAVVHIDRLHSVFEVIHDRVLRKRLRTSPRVTIQIETLAFGNAPEAPSANSIQDLTLTFDETKEGPKASISFRLPDDKQSGRVEVSIERKNRSPAAPTTRWLIATGECSLPCTLLSRIAASLATLGDECQFQGMIWGEQTPDGLRGEINGRLTNVDLHQLVGRRFSHELQGRADVLLERAHLLNGQLINAAGNLVVRRGSTSLSLLTAASKYLRLRQLRAVTRERVEFEQLRFGFQIDGRRLSVRGQCDERGTVMTDGTDMPLMAESDVPAVDKLELVRMLVPSTDIYVPLTAETAPLILLLSL